MWQDWSWLVGAVAGAAINVGFMLWHVKAMKMKFPNTNSLFGMIPQNCRCQEWPYWAFRRQSTGIVVLDGTKHEPCKKCAAGKVEAVRRVIDGEKQQQDVIETWMNKQRMMGGYGSTLANVNANIPPTYSGQATANAVNVLNGNCGTAVANISGVVGNAINTTGHAPRKLMATTGISNAQKP